MELKDKFYDCFQTEKRFEDKANFPYGFSMSGDFTIEQAQLLESKGAAYRDLASGERPPKVGIEREFVDFCQGRKNAESIHEKAWRQYIAKVNRNNKAVSFNKHVLSNTVTDEYLFSNYQEE